jgi:hypothetical protein
MCAYKAWVISPPTPSIPSINYLALISNFHTAFKGRKREVGRQWGNIFKWYKETTMNQDSYAQQHKLSNMKVKKRHAQRCRK